MFLRLTTSSAALALLMAPPAFSLTADEVWQTWEESLTINGHGVTIGEREDAGDALILRDVELSIFSRSSTLAELIVPEFGFSPVDGPAIGPIESDDIVVGPPHAMVDATPPQNDPPYTMMEITFPQIELTPTGGDAVRIGLPEEISFSLIGRTSDDDGDVTKATETIGIIDASQIEAIASEEDGKQRWVTNGSSETLLMIDRLTLKEHTLECCAAIITVTDMKSDSLFRGPRQVEHVFTADKIGFMLGMEDEETVITLTGQIAGLELTAGHDYPEGQKADNSTALSAALAAGGKANGKLALGPVDISLDVQVEDPDDGPTSVAGKAASQSISLAFDMTKEGMRYQANIADITYESDDNDLPFPALGALDRLHLDIRLPVLGNKKAQPFVLRYKHENMLLDGKDWSLEELKELDESDLDELTGFSLAPTMVDIDLTGNIILEEDLLPFLDRLIKDPDTVGTLSFKPHDLTISNVALQVLWIAVNADGKVRFPDPDNLKIAEGKITVNYFGLPEPFFDDSEDAYRPWFAWPLLFLIDLYNTFINSMTEEVEGEEGTFRRTRLEFKEDGRIFLNGYDVNETDTE